MASTISISDEERDIWMVKNTIYAEYIDLVIEKLGESSLIEELKMSVDFNGIAIEEIESTNDAIQITSAMKNMATQISSGQRTLISCGDLDDEKCRNIFSELVELLSRWEEQVKT